MICAENFGTFFGFRHLFRHVLESPSYEQGSATSSSTFHSPDVLYTLLLSQVLFPGGNMADDKTWRNAHWLS